MDLASLNVKEMANEGADMEVLHPVTGKVLTIEEEGPDKGQPVTIRLIGKDSEDYQKAAHKLANKRLNSVSKSGKIKVTTEELEEEELTLLILATKGWKGLTLNKEPFSYSPDNAKKLYTDFPFIREQVSAFITERGSFMGNS
jgi:hypothetical protein